MEQPVAHLLEGANFGQLGTVDPDGSPHVDTVWIGFEGGRILVATTARTRKAKNLAANPAAFMVVTARDNPYEQAQLRLRLAAVEPDEDLVVCDRIAVKYTGRPFPQRHHPERVVLFFDIERIRYHIARV